MAKLLSKQLTETARCTTANSILHLEPLSIRRHELHYITQINMFWKIIRFFLKFVTYKWLFRHIIFNFVKKLNYIISNSDSSFEMHLYVRAVPSHFPLQNQYHHHKGKGKVSRSVFSINFSLPLFPHLFLVILFVSTFFKYLCSETGCRNNFVTYLCTFCVYPLCNKSIKKKG